MNNIILHACQQFITEAAEFFKAGKAVNLAEMEKGLKQSSDKFLRDIIKTCLEETERLLKHIANKLGTVIASDNR